MFSLSLSLSLCPSALRLFLRPPSNSTLHNSPTPTAEVSLAAVETPISLSLSRLPASAFTQDAAYDPTRYGDEALGHENVPPFGHTDDGVVVSRPYTRVRRLEMCLGLPMTNFRRALTPRACHTLCTPRTKGDTGAMPSPHAE